MTAPPASRTFHSWASLLYHALAAPTVVSDPAGGPLGGFLTIEEIETVENYVYATRAASLDALHAATNDLPVAIATGRRVSCAASSK
jgi:hypothetical protein